MNESPDLKRILLFGNYGALLAVIGVFTGLSLVGGASGISGELIAFLSMLAGALLANLKEAFGFSFGSSQSSQDKDKTISDMASTAQIAQTKETP